MKAGEGQCGGHPIRQIASCTDGSDPIIGRRADAARAKVFLASVCAKRSARFLSAYGLLSPMGRASTGCCVRTAKSTGAGVPSRREVRQKSLPQRQSGGQPLINLYDVPIFLQGSHCPVCV